MNDASHRLIRPVYPLHGPPEGLLTLKMSQVARVLMGSQSSQPVSKHD